MHPALELDTFSTLIMLWFFCGALAVDIKLLGRLTWAVVVISAFTTCFTDT